MKKNSSNRAEWLRYFNLQISKTENAQTIFRLGAFVVLAALIVLIFPRYNNTFRYDYKIGKPWTYSLLTAEFDFPIYKTDEQLEQEKKKLLSTFTPYYKYIPRVQREVKVVSLQEMEWMQQELCQQQPKLNT